MGWTEEVHASRLADPATRKNLNSFSKHQIQPPKADKSNAPLLPIALIAGAAASTLWWRKGGKKLNGGNDPLSSIGSFIQGLLGRRGRRTSQGKEGKWKAARPGSMAAAAAAQRAQINAQASTSGNAGGGQKQGGGKKKNKKKKKRNH